MTAFMFTRVSPETSSDASELGLSAVLIRPVLPASCTGQARPRSAVTGAKFAVSIALGASTLDPIEVREALALTALGRQQGPLPWRIGEQRPSALDHELADLGPRVCLVRFEGPS